MSETNYSGRGIAARVAAASPGPLAPRAERAGKRVAAKRPSRYATA